MNAECPRNAVFVVWVDEKHHRRVVRGIGLIRSRFERARLQPCRPEPHRRWALAPEGITKTGWPPAQLRLKLGSISLFPDLKNVTKPM